MNPPTKTMLTPEQLLSIRERAEKATPGEWKHGKQTEYGTIYPDKVTLNGNTIAIIPEIAFNCRLEEIRDEPIYQKRLRDVEFIAHARQDVPALLAHIKQLEQKLNDSRLAAFDAEDWTQAFCDELVGHGIASKCNFHDRNCIQSIQAEIIGKLARVKHLEKRAERAEKAEAEMRGLLKLILFHWFNANPVWGPKIKAVLSDTAGQTYSSTAEVHELVNPLVNILMLARSYVGDSDSILTAGLNNGLDYAREKGWCE